MLSWRFDASACHAISQAGRPAIAFVTPLSGSVIAIPAIRIKWRVFIDPPLPGRRRRFPPRSPTTVPLPHHAIVYRYFVTISRLRGSHLTPRDISRRRSFSHPLYKRSVGAGAAPVDRSGGFRYHSSSAIRGTVSTPCGPTTPERVPFLVRCEIADTRVVRSSSRRSWQQTRCIREGCLSPSSKGSDPEGERQF